MNDARGDGKDKIKAAVLGCTGLVGQHFVRLLANHPDFEIARLYASERSAGKQYREAAGWSIGGELPAAVANRTVDPIAAGDLAGSRVAVVFSALPASVAGPIEDALRRGGCAVFTNASAHRRDEDVPVLIPEVNPGHLDLVRRRPRPDAGFIVAGSNCSTAGLALALKPFLPLGLRHVSCVTYQSLSGAGRLGLAAPGGNVVPFIKDEEEKLDRETRKILGTWNGRTIEPACFEVAAHCARVPVREGHLLSVSLQVEKGIETGEAESLVAGFQSLPQVRSLPSAPLRPLILRMEADRPQPLLDVWAGDPERARGMAVSIGRIQAGGNRIRFFALVHNLVRGAAGLCVLNAELALRSGLLRDLVPGIRNKEAAA